METVLRTELSFKDLPGELFVFSEKIFADGETPVSIFEKLKPLKTFLLESARKDKRFGKSSFIGGRPLAVYSYRDKIARIKIKSCGTPVEEIKEDPLEPLEELIFGSEVEFNSKPEGFYGGFCGYLTYDAIERFEPVVKINKPPLKIPEAFFILPGFVISYNHLSHVAEIYITVFDKSEKKAEQKALREINEITGFLEKSSSLKTKTLQKLKPQGFGRIRSNFTEAEFVKAVDKIKTHISKGDIFQAVLSQGLTYPKFLDDFDLYRMLRVSNPSPYMFYFPTEKFSLVGASPEPLIKVTGKKIVVRPIAGTRPRGKTPEEDLQLERELLEDEKERAEHVMLVDLGRNDVGRVAKPGTVKLTSRMEVERYSHVMHIVSEVQGRLKEETNSLCALRASFPAGTVSGAPKIRAMQIIDKLETVRRGVYSGAFGYVNFSGDLDTCITIRTAFCGKRYIKIQAGAGIVQDSVPEKEYAETLSKAGGILEILENGVFLDATSHR